jgi:acyl-CoA thioester hydrolase
VTFNLRIDWSELDVFGHVNNVAFAKYMQAARVNLMDDIGIMKSYHEEKIGFMVAASSIVYLKPLFYPGEIEIETKVKEVKNTSFIIQHWIYDSDNVISAKGEDVIVYFDFNLNQKKEMNGELKSQLFNKM